MAVNEDVTMGDPLASLCTACAETEAINNIVETTLKQTQHVFAGNALHVRCHIIVLAELGLKNAVCSAAFLLFTELGAVFGSLASPCLTVLSRRSVTLHNSALCFVVAAIAFGLNSAAYVAEIVRSGIMSVDVGQFEAGRSLGLNYSQTMQLIILPQAIKNILPALLNEVISLLKETSISGYIGLMDLTKGGDIIRSNTYEAFLPLIAVAIIYLAFVMLLSTFVSKLERRLRSSER